MVSTGPSLKDRLNAAAKGLAGGLAGAIISVLFTTVTEPDAVVNPDAVPGADQVVQLPNTTAEWVTFAISVLVGFVFPYVKKNFPSIAAAAKQLEEAQNRVADGKQSA